MNRLPDWPERLNQLIESRRKAAFSYGVNDCCLFGADGVLAATGTDLAADYRGKYSSEAQAQQILQAAGGIRGLISMLPERAKGFAQRADLVIAELLGRETLGVSIGHGRWCAPGPRGLVFRSMSEVLAVFQV